MGLDNGFIIKNVKRQQLPIFIRYPFDYDFTEGEVEVAYFRKYWGFRNAYVRRLGLEEEYEYKLSKEDLIDAIDLLTYYIRTNPSDADNGYWDKHTLKNLRRNRWNLFWVYLWYRSHPDAEIYFYDSY